MSNTTTSALSDINVLVRFLTKVKEYQKTWVLEKSKDNRLKFIQTLVNDLVDIINLPRIQVLSADTGSNFTIGLYDPYKFKEDNKTINPSSNTITVNSRRLSVGIGNNSPKSYESASVIDDFYKVAITMYHEVRHYEQFFRAVQADVRSRTPYVDNVGLGLKRNVYLNISPSLITAARQLKIDGTYEYKLTDDRKDFAKLMRETILYRASDDDYLKSDGQDPNIASTIEKDAYVFNKIGYNILTNGKTRGWNKAAFDLSDSAYANDNRIIQSAIKLYPHLKSQLDNSSNNKSNFTQLIDPFGELVSTADLVYELFISQEDIRSVTQNLNNQIQNSSNSLIQSLESPRSQSNFSSKETVSEILDAYEAYDYTAAERSQIATNLSYFKTGFASLVDEELNSLGFTTAKGEAEYLRSKFTAAGIPITDQTTTDLIIAGLDPNRFTPAQKTAITTALSTTPAPTAQQQNDWDIVQSMLGEVAQYLKNVPGTQGIIQALETTGQGVNLLQGLTGVVQNNPQTADKLRLALDYFAQQPGTLGDIGKGASLATAVYTVAQTSYNRFATGQELDSAQIAQTIGRVQSIGALDPQTASLLLRINNAATGIAAISRDLSAGQDFKAYQDLKTVAGAIFQGDDLIKVNGYLATFEQTYRTIQNTYNGLNDSGDLLSVGLSLLTDSTLFSLKDSMPGVSAASSTYQVINNTIAAFNGESGAAEKAIASALKDPAIKQLIGTEGMNLVTSSNLKIDSYSKQFWLVSIAHDLKRDIDRIIYAIFNRSIYSSLYCFQ
jgi:hypothetical protein